VRTPGYEFSHDWQDWEQISRTQLAVVAAEDQHFPAHYGFDFKQIDKAGDRERGRRVRGASTICSRWPEPLPVARAELVRKGPRGRSPS
jgi:monofunctional biosynthetic peptidoglycan transglycosylase